MVRALSPQARTAYQQLINTSSAMTAKELAEKLGVLPHSVYRSLKSLTQFGLTEELGNRPKKIKAKASSAALTTFLLVHKNWFEKNFAGPVASEDKTSLDISFIQNRDELMEQSTEDTGRAKKEVCLIISGHGIGPETLLQNKRALERGVSIKILSQHLTAENKEMLKNWQKMGIEVRVGPSIGARVFVFDSEIVYVVSYNVSQKNEAVGVRFKYQPVAQLMRDLFIERWKAAEKI